PLEGVDRDPNTNEIILLKEAFQNAGSRKARGIDFGLSYQLETQVGVFTSLTQVTYLDSLQFAQVPGEPEQELRSNGALNRSENALLEWKGISRLDWDWRGVSTGVTAYYLDGFHEILKRGNSLSLPFPNGVHEHYVKATWMFDVRASYSFNLVPPVVSPLES